ncbi:ferrous iron transporter A (plasmid) [Borreliella finlandensis]|uniref:ferrous iron transporter A n=1 Tax=Borreliella finlandensis TaxID=498741 RepID=UPI003AF11F69
MKVKSKYLVLGLLFGFIGCDLSMRDKTKEKSLGLFDNTKSVLDDIEEPVKKSINKKEKEKVDKKEPPTHHIKKWPANASNLLQKNVMTGGENLKTELLREQNEHKRLLQKSLNSLSSESGEFQQTIIKSNEIDFTIDSDLRPQGNLKTISGSNTISHTDEIEEEDYDQYDLEEYNEYSEKYREYAERTRLRNRHESYLEGFKYNVDSATKTIGKIYDDYTLFTTKKTLMYSTYLDYADKEKAREEAKKFTKKELEKDFQTLLNYIQTSIKTATNFVCAKEIHAKIKPLNEIEEKIKTLISKIKEQYDSYEAYKAIESSISSIKDYIKAVQGSINQDGVWHYI